MTEMSEPEQLDTAVSESPAPVEPTAEAPASEPAGDDPAALRREAATYRRRLRDAEAERDGLRAQVDARDRADAERLAAAHMESGTDLWHDVRDDAGALDPERVNEAVGRVLATHPTGAGAARAWTAARGPHPRRRRRIP